MRLAKKVNHEIHQSILLDCVRAKESQTSVKALESVRENALTPMGIAPMTLKGKKFIEKVSELL